MIRISNSCGSRLVELVRIREVLPLIEGNLLDIGCGCNNLVNNYKKIYGGDGIGVDVFAWSGVDEVVKNSSKLKYSSDSFDTISFLANLNHIPYRQEVLKEAYRLLKNGGLLIVTMLSEKFGKVWHKFPEKLWGERKKGRVFAEGEMGGIDSEEVTRLIRVAGFKNIERRRFSIFNNLFIARKP